MAQQKPKLSTQRGSAIIIALFVMALAATAAVAMLTRMNIDVRRTQLLLNASQANLYAQGSVAWAIDQLNMDLKQQKPNQLIDKTPIQSKVDNVRGFKISSTIYDAQANFNLNNFTTDGYQNILLRLVRNLDPQVELSNINDIIIALHDWVNPGGSDENAGYYSKLNPPYRAPHRLMASPSEFRLLKGVAPETFKKLLPYITALPSTTAININNAPIPVLMSLSASMTKEAAQTIDARRKQSPFTNVQDFLNFDVVKNNPIKPAMVTVNSNFFLVKTNVTVGQQQTILYTLLARAGSGSQSNTTVLWQTKGTQ